METNIIWKEMNILKNTPNMLGIKYGVKKGLWLLLMKVKIVRILCIDKLRIWHNKRMNQIWQCSVKFYGLRLRLGTKNFLPNRLCGRYKAYIFEYK